MPVALSSASAGNFRGVVVCTSGFSWALRAMCGIWLALSASAQAQAQASLSGTVTDSAGEPVARAEVLLRGSRSATRSGDDGRFELSPVATGEQTVVVSAPGYNPLHARG